MNNSVRPRALDLNVDRIWNGFVGQRGRAFGYMIIGALMAFEVFNFSTTDFALRDVLGDLKFIGLPWATILSVAFCGIDFAGIARIFTPEQGSDEPAEVWYLFGAWVLAAAMNAMLTWWGVSVAIVGHQSQGAAVVGTEIVQKVVPIFVAVMVWVIRILIIGTFSIAGERMFSMADTRARRSVPANPYNQARTNTQSEYARPTGNHTINSRPAPAYQTSPSRASNQAPRHAAPPAPANVASRQSLPANTPPVTRQAAPAGSERPVLTTAANLRPAPRPMPRPEGGYQARPVNPMQAAARPEPARDTSEPTYHNLADS